MVKNIPHNHEPVFTYRVLIKKTYSTTTNPTYKKI